ncbi:MAG: flagellar basal body P-ring protein FlgI [Bdellovibrionales bacterium]
MKKIILFSFLALVFVESVNAARLKDMANVRGVRDNQLVGYGLIIGLKGTGDGKNEFTSKSMQRMLATLGVTAEDVESSNVAAVVMTATLPPFARAGNRLDVQVNSVGDASSLKGGTLVQSPLRAANGKIFAVAQGNVLIGGDHTTAGRVPNGAIIEKDLAEDFSNRKMFRITLHNPDFTTAMRVVRKINGDLGGKYASAKDSATVDLVVPGAYEGNAIELLSLVESLEVSPDLQAKVVINEKTGTVVIGEYVKINKVAISHGDLTLDVGGKKKKGEKSKRMFLMDKGVSVGEIVKAMNQLGVDPQELITILQTIKAAGALQAELEVL